MKKKDFFYYQESSILQIIKYRVISQIKSNIKNLIIFYRYKNQIKKTLKLKSSKSNKKAFVFANGPSVNKLDPEKINGFNYDIFCVNGFLFSEFSKKVHPNYYILSDPSYFNGAKGNDSQRNIKLNNKLLEKIDNNKITLFAPLEHLNLCKVKYKYGFNDVENIFSNNVYNITKPRSYRSMTAYKALAIACFLGYEEIYICGFDNSYFQNLEVDSDNNLSYVIPHLVGGESHRVFLEDVPGCGKNIGEYLYLDHNLFEDLEKFKSKNIFNLDKSGLVSSFSKKHDLDIYVDKFAYKNS